MYRRCAVAVTLSIMLVLSGCGSPSGVTYIPDGATYTADQLASARDTPDSGPLVDTRVSEAAELRQQNLADLRLEGEGPAALADALTAQFPPEYAGVPFYVELGSFESAPAWIVVEAWGDEGGRLDKRRVWVFSAADLTLIAAQ